jgi:hypothetical protein
MEDKDTSLRKTFVDAYPVYVASTLVCRGIEMNDLIADSIVEGAAVLDGLLAHLEATPYELQRQSPLELFREALRPVGRALNTEGVAPPEVNPGVVSLVAWDTYGLAPAASASLGPAAHEAHLRWGVSKAKAMVVPRAEVRRPTVAVMCSLRDRDAIEQQVVSAGYAVSGLVGGATICVVEVGHGRPTDELTNALTQGARTIAFGSELTDAERAALRAQGVWKIVSREQALTDLGAILPSFV